MYNHQCIVNQFLYNGLMVNQPITINGLPAIQPTNSMLNHPPANLYYSVVTAAVAPEAFAALLESGLFRDPEWLVKVGDGQYPLFI